MLIKLNKLAILVFTLCSSQLILPAAWRAAQARKLSVIISEIDSKVAFGGALTPTSQAAYDAASMLKETLESPTASNQQILRRVEKTQERLAACQHK